MSSTAGAATSTINQVAAPAATVAPTDDGVVGDFHPQTYGIHAAYVMTPKTHTQIYSWHGNDAWPVASLTKLVSALVWKNRTLPMSKVVTLLAKDEVGGGRLRVPVGTKVYFQDLWYSSITSSANNAAMALARLSGLTTKQLLAKMNAEAKLAGATHATFVDATGMSTGNSASAKDMALIADRAYQFKPIQKAASTTGYVVTMINEKHKPHPIWTTNNLLRYDPEVWVIAGKTGYLEEAEHNVVVWLRPVGVDGKPEMGKDVLIVIYGAPDTTQLFAATKALAQSLWKTHEFTTPKTGSRTKK